MLSAARQGLAEADVARIRKLFVAAGLPTRLRLTAAQCERLFRAMQLDKKVSGGEIKFVLARRIGEVIWGQPVPTPPIEQALNHSAFRIPHSAF